MNRAFENDSLRDFHFLAKHRAEPTLLASAKASGIYKALPATAEAKTMPSSSELSLTRFILVVNPLELKLLLSKVLPYQLKQKQALVQFFDNSHRSA